MHYPITRRLALASAIAATVLAWLLKPAFADWREDLGTFRIGMIEAVASRLSPGELDRIRTAYSNALEMPAEIHRARDLPALVDALVSGRVDYAMMSTAAYASSYLACSCTEPVAHAAMTDGSTGTIAVLLVDAKIQLGSLPASKGIGVPGRDNFNAYAVTLANLPAVLPAFNASVPFLHDSKSMEGAVGDFAAGKIDALIAAIPDNRKPGEELQQGDGLLAVQEQSGRKAVVAWRSAAIPNAPHAVRQNLPAEAKKALVGFLESLFQQDPDLNDILLPEGAVAFKRVDHAAFANALNAAKALAANSNPPAP